ncbi:MAG: hypothetical protein HOC33_01755 [Alphaproteobacteria bacterium]|nr:hypothetical protein [Alphaproteobacteria bacterium]MBT4542542.1 hypothetical protein [Alphaproteobacteria bacterium]
MRLYEIEKIPKIGDDQPRLKYEFDAKAIRFLNDGNETGQITLARLNGLKLMRKKEAKLELEKSDLRQLMYSVTPDDIPQTTKIPDKLEASAISGAKSVSKERDQISKMALRAIEKG